MAEVTIPRGTKKELIRDLIVVAASLGVAVALAESPALQSILRAGQSWHALGSFVAGIFFTSVFTTAPATVALAEIATSNSIWITALFGAAGALLGDLFIFRFVRDNVARDFEFVFREIRQERRWLKLHHHWKELHAFKWLIPLIGALLIASPLPDEIGLTILGLSKIKMRVMIPLTFSLNFLGIVGVGLIGRALI
jgi:hypothetical protein